MSHKFLKARIPAALYDTLQTRAATEGQRLSTHVREVLEHHTQAIGTLEALARIEGALLAAPAAMAPPQPSAMDHETRQTLREIRLLARELAMATNAQIVAKVAAQMKSQSV